RIHRGAVGGIDDEDAAGRRFAVVGDQCPRRHHVDAVIGGFVEMDAVVAVMLGPHRHHVFLVEGVDDEQHGRLRLFKKHTSLPCAAILGIGNGKSSSSCLVGTKEGVPAAAPGHSKSLCSYHV